MSKEDFKNRYPGKSKQAVNKAIRAECAGGDEVLDARELFSAIASREAGAAKKIADLAQDHLHKIREAMAAEVLARYDFENWGEPFDLLDSLEFEGLTLKKSEGEENMFEITTPPEADYPEGAKIYLTSEEVIALGREIMRIYRGILG